MIEAIKEGKPFELKSQREAEELAKVIREERRAESGLDTREKSEPNKRQKRETNTNVIVNKKSS